MMMENGLHTFYESFAGFLVQLRGRSIFNIDEDDLQTLTVEHLKGPLLLCCYTLAFAWLLLLIEIISFNLNRRRNNRIRHRT